MTEHQPRVHEPGPHPLYYDAVIKMVMSPLMHAYDLRHEGAEVLSEIEGPVIVSPVHRSMLDIPAVSVAIHQSTNEHGQFLTKSELQKPPLNKLITWGGGIFIDRSQSTMPAETEAHIAKRAENNAIVVVYPEGTRMSGNIVNPKNIKGVPLLATKYGFTVVPVGIAGTEKGDRKPISVVFGDPIEVYKSESDIGAARAAVKLRGVLALAMQAAQYEAIDLRKK